MPGIFGGSGVPDSVRQRMEREWAEVWSDGVDVARLERAFLGGHAFGSSVVQRSADGGVSARDGAGFEADGPQPDNVALLSPVGDVELRSDASGVFPLYYAVLADGFIFSSLLRPLARALGSEPDPVGIAEFVRFAYTTGGRSMFRGVSRTIGGQVVRWNARKGLVIRDEADTWVGILDDLTTPDEAAELVAPVLRDAVRKTLPATGLSVVMMSAGWDSRTLLAAASSCVPAQQLQTFSHGDLASRELRLAAAVSRKAGVSWTARAIGPDVWDLDHLDRSFSRTETLIFPHWSWAARANPNADCLFSGVLGEVLGGHYGSTQLAQGGRKVVTLLSAVRAPGRGQSLVDVDRVRSGLRLASLGRPWYLAEEVEGDERQRTELLDLMNDGIEGDLAQLQRRGVASADQLLEAFITEHRGVQYISGQAVATRCDVNAGVPFADARLLALASRIPAWLKVHNRVNRSLGLRLAPHLQHVPMAATLVPASWPLLLQEGSRVARRLYEDLRRWSYVKSGGRISQARLGWVNFEFLREGSTLPDVMDSLTADLWDRERMWATVRSAQTLGGRGSLHPLFDQMGKILTVDRMLSGH